MISILKICGPKLLSEETQAGAANAETPVSQKAERYSRRCMLPESRRRLLLRLHRVALKRKNFHRSIYFQVFHALIILANLLAMDTNKQT